jgi:hypothetical protein
MNHQHKSFLQRYKHLSFWNKLFVWSALATFLGLILAILSLVINSRPPDVPSSNSEIFSQPTEIPDLSAPWTEIVHDIGGQINSEEWASAKLYTLSFTNQDDSKHLTWIYLMHDSQYLFIGIKSGYQDGWDTRFHFYVDGNHNHAWDGTDDLAHPIDFFFGIAAPSGWSGYNYFDTRNPSTIEGRPPQSPPKGFERSSVIVDNTVNYEFRIPLDAMNITPGDEIGIFFLNDGGATSNLVGGYPIKPDELSFDSSQWAVLLIEK